jgi:hypothetical protein
VGNERAPRQLAARARVGFRLSRRFALDERATPFVRLNRPDRTHGSDSARRVHRRGEQVVLLEE